MGVHVEVGVGVRSDVGVIPTAGERVSGGGCSGNLGLGDGKAVEAGSAVGEMGV